MFTEYSKGFAGLLGTKAVTPEASHGHKAGLTPRVRVWVFSIYEWWIRSLDKMASIRHSTLLIAFDRDDKDRLDQLLATLAGSDRSQPFKSTDFLSACTLFQSAKQQHIRWLTWSSSTSYA